MERLFRFMNECNSSHEYVSPKVADIWQVNEILFVNITSCWRHKVCNGKKSIANNLLTDLQSLIQSKVVRAETGLWAGRSGVQISTIYYPKMTRPNVIFNGYRDIFQDVKRPGRDADQLPSYSAEVKNEWSCTSISPYMPAWRGKVHFTYEPFSQANISIYRS